MSFFGDIFAGKSAQAAANYNAAIIERNAKIDDQKAEQLMSVHNEYSLPKFDKTVEMVQGKTTVAYLSSGAEMSGTVLEALYDQQLEFDRDRDIMNYNAERYLALKRHELEVKRDKIRAVLFNLMIGGYATLITIQVMRAL